MKPLVMFSPEIKITANGVSISINGNKYVIQELKNYDSIFLTAKAGYISIYALRLFALNKMPIQLRNLNGEVIYNLIPEYPVMKPEIRIKQYEAYLNRRQTVADNIVKAKKETYNNVLQEHNKPVVSSNRENVFSYQYFNHIGTLINDYGYEWVSRQGLHNQKNATNIINSVMNFYYGLIEHRLLNAIAENGLDWQLSFLHEPTYNKLSLTYDLIEYLRGYIDNVVLSLARDRFIQRRHFEITDSYYMLKENRIPSYIAKIKPVENKIPETIKTFINVLEA